MALRADDTKEVEVQFQLDRSSFCRMQYGLDHLPTVELVFPNLAKPTTHYAELTHLDARFV